MGASSGTAAAASPSPARSQVVASTTTTETGAYVSSVYRHLFGRAPDPGGLAAWSSALSHGTPRIAVANAITSSAEYRSKLIAGSYRQYLARTPDPRGLANWLAAMGAGMTIQSMEGGFIASPEYYSRAGGNDSAWVDRLYRDVLGRTASASEVRGWTAELGRGASRSRVAMGFLLSTEHLTTVVDRQYRDLLGRSIDPAGRASWVAAIQAGTRLEAVVGGIIASDEYQARSRPAGSPPITSGTPSPPASVPTPTVPASPVADSTNPTDGAARPVSAKLSWAPPALSNPTTVKVSATNRDLRLAVDRDYIVTMPTTPLDVPGGLVISGGRNVVLIGGEIRMSRTNSVKDGMRGLYLKGQSGTVHIEGLKITGAALAEGINLDQRLGATVQLQNVRIDTVHGSRDGHHADIIQTWAGPGALKIDRMTGYTEYQGFFLLPNQHLSQPQPKAFDFRHMNLVSKTDGGYLLWRDDANWPVHLDDVWASPSRSGLQRSQFLWARGPSNKGTWDKVQVGAPPGGDFVPAGAAGLRYVSPGYAPVRAG